MKKIMLLLAIAFAFTLTPTLAMAAGNADDGESVYYGDGKCKKCHNKNMKKKVGPGLQGLFNRTDEKWVAVWLKDPKGTWTANEDYMQTLKTKMKKVKKTKPSHKTKELSDKEIKDLIAFIKTF